MAGLIHDLTENQIIESSNRSELRFLFNRSFRDILSFSSDEDDQDIHTALVLTGDKISRECKKYQLDFEGEQNICDCCGSYILRKPWNFDEYKSKLCDDCENFFSKKVTLTEMTDSEMTEGQKITMRIIPRPWEFRDSDRLREIDNPLLWD